MPKFIAWNRKTKKRYTPGGKTVFRRRTLEWLLRTRGGSVAYKRVSKPPTRTQRIVAVATRELGVVETPAGSNSGPRVRRYQRATNVPGTGWPWCMAYVQWVAREAGCKLSYRGAYVPDFKAWAKRTGRYTDKPHVGYAVCFEFTGDTIVDHVGIVTKIIDAEWIETIEGNTSAGDSGSQSNGGGVFKRRRHISTTRGFLRMV